MFEDTGESSGCPPLDNADWTCALTTRDTCSGSSITDTESVMSILNNVVSVDTDTIDGTTITSTNSIYCF